MVFGNKSANQNNQVNYETVTVSVLELICRISSFLAAVGHRMTLVKVEQNEKANMLVNHGFTIC